MQRARQRPMRRDAFACMSAPIFSKVNTPSGVVVSDSRAGPNLLQDTVRVPKKDRFPTPSGHAHREPNQHWFSPVGPW